MMPAGQRILSLVRLARVVRSLPKILLIHVTEKGAGVNSGRSSSAYAHGSQILAQGIARAPKKAMHAIMCSNTFRKEVR